MKPRPVLLLLSLFFALFAGAQKAPTLQPKAGDFVIKDFHFHSGEVLPELRLHYNTLGSPVRDADGKVTNAVLILHGTSGSGKRYLEDSFTQAMYGPGQPLDVSRWYIILPDSIGHGQSSKPSDALHARFPHYDYDDMIEAQYRLVTESLGVNHLRLVTGISMGGMHTWLWGEQHPDFMEALMPMVSQPIEIAGRNRMWRRAAADAIRNDPAWNNGEYQQPPAGLVFAARLFAIAVSGDFDLQRRAPTRDDADRLLDLIAQRWVQSDANDLLYQLESSRNYNPQPNLERIQAPLIAINASDDFINPIDLGSLPTMIKRVESGRYVELSSTGMGHGTVNNPNLWSAYLVELLGAAAR
jgi:homoserine O-acetyltransferase/O-succinyltransferase